MYVEERIYRLKIGAVPEYCKIYEEFGMKTQLYPEDVVCAWSCIWRVRSCSFKNTRTFARSTSARTGLTTKSKPPTS